MQVPVSRVVWLGDAAERQGELGNKAANLSALIRAGFPVPAGFVITTTAYAQFVASSRLQEEIDRRVEAARGADLSETWRAADEIHALFMAAPISEEIAADIRAAYVDLNPNRFGVAVRSSAAGEDSETVSFAGVLDTILNVHGEAALLDAIKRCWASLWSDRAIGYRAGRDGHPPAGHSVIVHRMVDATAAGVLFTINPMSGDAGQVVINSAWGLGDAIVGGRVTPDVFVLEKSSGAVIEWQVASKAVESRPSAGGTDEVPVDASRRDAPSLSVAQAVALARLGGAIEAHFGGAQDVEWALEQDEIRILQARPATTARESVRAVPHAGSAPPPSPGDDAWPALDERPAMPFDRWTLANVGELWAMPVSPIVASTVPSIIGGAVRHSLRGLDPVALDRVQWAKRWHGRVYYNEGALKHVLAHELGLPSTFFDRSRGHRGASDALTSRFRPLSFVRRLPVLARIVARQWGTARDMQAVVTDIDQRTAAHHARPLAAGSDRELWAEMEAWFERMKHALNLQNDMSGYSLAHFSLLERLVGRWTGQPHVAHELVSGLAEIETAEIGPALADIATAVRSAGLTDTLLAQHPRAALRQLRADPRGVEPRLALDRFLEKHGHRCANDAEWLYPRWADRPEDVVDMVAAYLRLESGVDPADTARRQQERRRETTAAVEAPLGWLRRRVFRSLLARTQHAVRLRDNGKNAAMKACYPARRSLHQMGERWTGRGWLLQADDVFFLTVQDLTSVLAAGDPATAGLDLVALVARRKRAHAYWFGQPTYDAFDAAGRPIATPPGHEDRGDVMHGIAASTGVATGKARVVRHPREAMRLGPGDILVTHATDAGWSAVFPLIGGLITEIGGQLSHAAILAREYGLPAVVNVTDATVRIDDGQTLTVDGARGSVLLHDPLPLAPVAMRHG